MKKKIKKRAFIYVRFDLFDMTFYQMLPQLIEITLQPTKCLEKKTKLQSKFLKQNFLY